MLQFLGEKIISHRLAKDLERYKIELTERTDVLKTQLSIFSHEQTVAISRVDSQRSEAIHKVYAAVREVINPATLLMSGTPFVNADEAHDLRFYGANAELAHAACGRLRISANVTGDFGNVTDLRSGAGLRLGDCRDGVVLTGLITSLRAT